MNNDDTLEMPCDTHWHRVLFRIGLMENAATFCGKGGSDEVQSSDACYFLKKGISFFLYVFVHVLARDM